MKPPKQISSWKTQFLQRRIRSYLGSLVAQMVKNACDAGDLGLIPGLGRSPKKGMATHSSILAWRITQTEEPGRLWSMGLQRVQQD